MKSYLLHFIRNGQMEESGVGKYIGHTDLPLSATGVQELRRLAEDFAYPQPAAVFSSPLLRCTQSAEILFPAAKPIVLDGLMEYNFGEFEGKSAEELQEHPLFPAWLAGEEDVEPPFGESGSAFSRRIQTTFAQLVQGLLKTGTTNSAIVTHGGVIMAILAAFGLPEAAMHDWMAPEGCGFTARLTPSLWSRGAKFEVIAKCPDAGPADTDADDIASI